MGAAFAVLLIVLLSPRDSTQDVLPYAQVAPGSSAASDVLAGRVRFHPIRGTAVPTLSWLRFSLRERGSGRWVTFLPATVDHATAYIPESGGRYRIVTFGTGVPLADHPQPYLRPAFGLGPAALQGAPIYLRVHYYPDTPFFIRVTHEPEAIVAGFDLRLLQGIFFGVLLAIGLCNLYVAIAVRERSAAFFVGYIATLILNELAATGIGAQYLWPHAAPDTRSLTLLTNTLAFLAGLLFTRSFLQTRYAAPAWDRMLIAWFIAEAALDTLRHALPNGLALAPLLLAVQLGGMLITVGAGIVRVRQGFGPARFFVLAFAPAIAGYMANLAYDIYQPPGNWFLAGNGVELGFMFESIIFSFSLLDRIRTLDEANVKLRTVAARDPLTGLYNRTAFFERFELEIESAGRKGRGLGVLYIDLDGFKSINDRYGHRTGDLLLQIVARRLRTAVRDSDTIARLGGDELAVLVTSVNSPDILETVRTDVMRMADTPVTIEGNVLYIGVSAGAALYPRDGNEADRLIEASDRAMYAVKQARAQAVMRRESTTPA